MQAALFRMRPEQSLSCRRVCRMKSLRIRRGYICLPSLCLHYVELNKRIISKTAAMAHRHMRRSAIWIGTAGICLHGGLRFPYIGRMAICRIRVVVYGPSIQKRQPLLIINDN